MFRQFEKNSLFLNDVFLELSNVIQIMESYSL